MGFLDVSFAIEFIEEETARRRAEEELNRINEELEDRIQERPFMSILISFLAGLILAKIMNRT